LIFPSTSSIYVTKLTHGIFHYRKLVHHL